MARKICQNITVSGARVTLTNAHGAQVSFVCNDAASAEFVAGIFQANAGESIPKASVRAKVKAVIEQDLAALRAETTPAISADYPAIVADTQRAADKERLDRAMGLKQSAFGESFDGLTHRFGLVGSK